MNWQDLFKNLGLFSIGVAAIGFLASRLLTQLLGKELEAYKGQLTHANEAFKGQLALENETFKAGLQRQAKEFEIKFTRLHTDRAQAIKDLYARLVDMRDLMEDYTSPLQVAGDLSKDEKQRAAHRAVNDFLAYYGRNRILFDEKVCGMIDSINTVMRDVWFDFLYVRQISETPGLEKEKHEKWLASWKRIREDIPPIEKELMTEFRRMLGVSDN